VRFAEVCRGLLGQVRSLGGLLMFVEVCWADQEFGGQVGSLLKFEEFAGG
jgi:hypothetical protein